MALLNGFGKFVIKPELVSHTISLHCVEHFTPEEFLWRCGFNLSAFQIAFIQLRLSCAVLRCSSDSVAVAVALAQSQIILFDLGRNKNSGRFTTEHNFFWIHVVSFLFICMNSYFIMIHKSFNLLNMKLVWLMAPCGWGIKIHQIEPVVCLFFQSWLQSLKISPCIACCKKYDTDLRKRCD